MSERDIIIKSFDCGLKFALKPSNSQVSYCALSIKSGTRNEPDSFNGMAHMTEHMLFKGTAKRTSTEINNRLERLGGELNAYTTKEETVIYSTVLQEDLSKALDLLFEIACTSIYPQKELDKERGVVIDEINMYKDTPSDSIFDDFEEIVFGSHPLSKSILGSAKSLKRINSEAIRDYTKNCFKPENMAVSVVCSLPEQKVTKIVDDCIEKYIGSYSAETNLKRYAPNDVQSLRIGEQFKKTVNKKNHQVNCIIGATAYSLYDDNRMALILLSNILGGPASNSRLNQSLRERSALVYTVESSYTQYADTGVIMIYFGCEKPNLERCIELVHNEISKLRVNLISDRALASAKKQLLGQLAVASDNGEAKVLSMGKSLLSYGSINSNSEIRRQIDAIDSKTLQRVANEVLSEDRLSTLIYL